MAVSLTSWLGARPLFLVDFDVEQHPLFEEYVAGVLYAAEKGELVTLWFMDPAFVDELKNAFRRAN